VASLAKALASSTGKKILIGITGLALVGFLIIHLTGNLLIFLGPETFNNYSHTLLSNPLIYVAQVGLIALFLMHIGTAIINAAKNRGARPDRYAVKSMAGHTSRKGIASTTMIVSGLVMLVFLPLHLRTLKFGPHYEGEAGVRDLHTLVMETFSKPGYVIWYVVAMALVGMHLWHGVSSAFQSLGADHPRYTPAIRKVGFVLALILGGGFISIPVIIYLGLI
jgi:succinate dehydrogenase / fumarate reductase, cytochrome b subunit